MTTKYVSTLEDLLQYFFMDKPVDFQVQNSIYTYTINERGNRIIGYYDKCIMRTSADGDIQFFVTNHLACVNLLQTFFTYMHTQALLLENIIISWGNNGLRLLECAPNNTILLNAALLPYSSKFYKIYKIGVLSDIYSIKILLEEFQTEVPNILPVVKTKTMSLLDLI